MMSSGDTIYKETKVRIPVNLSDVQKYHLDFHASQFFYEVRPRFTARQTIYTASALQKFLAVLWTTQEILKLLVHNPTWASPSDRPGLRELQWDDKTSLQFETSENTRLLLRHLPLREQIEQRAKLAVEQEISQQEPSHPHSVHTAKEKPKILRHLLQAVRKIFTPSRGSSIQ